MFMSVKMQTQKGFWIRKSTMQARATQLATLHN